MGDSLTTDDHYAEEQLTNPALCYIDDITTNPENGHETEGGENMINVFFQINETKLPLV